ncbi:MAG: site-specific integrase [Clostridia bacterium]|nr:site-specific integrase [Clostridia bacterium]
MADKRKLGHIKKLEEGKFLIRVSMGFDEFGKRLQVSKTVFCASEREAEKELALLYAEREQLAEDRRSGAPKTLAALYREWSEAHVSTLEENSKAFYASLWENHIKEFGKLNLSALSPSTCKKIIGNENSRTAEAVYKMLKAMCSKAVLWGYIEKNYFEYIDAPKHKAKEKLIFDENQLGAVARFVRSEDLKYQLLFYFAAVCGMRRQEIVALKWDDIDLGSCSFRVCRAAVAVAGKGTVLKSTKTASSCRRLHLPEFLERLLIRYQVEQFE